MSLARPRLLVVGNGMAANRLISQLQVLADDRFNIMVIGQEREPAYNRILLTPWLNGEIEQRELALQSADWYTRHGIAMHTGDAVTSLDLGNRNVHCQSGTEFSWDLLVLATGSQALIPPIPGHDLDGVMCLRTQQDAIKLKTHCLDSNRAHKHVLVMGGGVLGLEAACSLNALGVTVTVVHRDAWLMNRQLDEESGLRLAGEIRARGIAVYTGMQCSRLLSDTRDSAQLTAAELVGASADSSPAPVTIPCDTAVLAIGIKPEITLAQTAGLRCERAIVVDGWLRSSQTGVFALGECCQINQELFGLVAPVYQQADVLAALLASGQWHRTKPSVKPWVAQTLATKLKVAGLDVCSVGMLPSSSDASEQRSLIWRDPVRQHYRRLWLHDNVVKAAVAIGDIRGVSELAPAIDDAKSPTDPLSVLLASEMDDSLFQVADTRTQSLSTAGCAA